MVDLSLVGIFVNYLMESQLSTKFASFLLLSNRSVKQRLYIFSVILSNENKQRLYKIQKRPTSLFYHVLLIKQNECILKKPLCAMCSNSYGMIMNVKMEDARDTDLVDYFTRGSMTPFSNA